MGFLKILAGAAQLALGSFLIATGAGSWIGAMLIASGAGMVLGGVGTLLQPGTFDGQAITQRHPTAPRKIVYGRVLTGGVISEGECR